MSSSVRSGSVSSKLAAPLRVGARDPLRRRAGLPDAQEPDPVEAQPRQPVELGVGHVVQGRAPAQRARQLGQPDAGVDLVQRRVAWIGHGRSSVRSRRFSADLFSDDPGQYAAALDLEQGPGVDPAEQVHQGGDQGSPSCLVTGAEAGAIVTVEVLVEQDEVAPVDLLRLVSTRSR